MRIGPIIDAGALAGKQDRMVLPGTFTWDTLPDPAANMDMYARVTNLFGGVAGVEGKRDLVLASRVGSLAFWQPVRPDYAGQVATPQANSAMTIRPLGSPSMLLFTGGVPLGVAMNLTLDPAGGWPGCTKEFKIGGSVLGSFNLLGTGLGTAVSLLAGSQRRFFLDYVGGALKWVQWV